MPLFSNSPNQISNQSTLGNCLPECSVPTEVQEAKGSKRARMRASGLFMTSAVVFLMAMSAMGASAASAFAASSPWWSVTSSASPTYLPSGLAKDEVQEITTAPSAAFALMVNGTSLGYFESEPYPPYGVTQATAANVQTALESVYGPGNVKVTGGPGGTAPLIVTSINEDADRSVPRVEAVGIFGTAEAKVVTEGRADGQIVVTATNLGDGPVNGATTPVRILDTLPEPELTAVAIEGAAGTG